MTQHSYGIDCQCGQTIPVAASMAGSSVICTCGNSTKVPRLSELRKMVGQGAYESGIIDIINRMIDTGELPYGRECVLSGFPTNDLHPVRVECEKKWTTGAGKGRGLFVIFTVLFMPFWIIWALIGKALLDDPRRELGRDTAIEVPLRVHSDFREKLRGMTNQRALQKLLRTVPIYSKLLDEYPHAKIAT